MRNHSALGTRWQECYRFEDIEDFAHVIGVRYRLIPYIYSEYLKAVRNDDMYFKPLGFEYPNDKRAVETEYQLFVGQEIMIAPVYTQNMTGRYVYLPEDMKFVKFMPDGTIYEEELSKGSHYINVELNEVPLFIRKDRCIPVVDVACSVDEIDMSTIRYIGYEDAAYVLEEQ
jgi:alpha-glucosidase